MAIERVYVQNNTSIIADEVLSHRLGLVPIHADPRRFSSFSDPISEDNTIVFRLSFECPKGATKSVFSKDIVWVPSGDQAQKFTDDPIKVMDDDILLAKMTSGQSLDIELHAVKGEGKDHTKWSPVCIITS